MDINEKYKAEAHEEVCILYDLKPVCRWINNRHLDLHWTIIKEDEEDILLCEE